MNAPVKLQLGQRSRPRSPVGGGSQPTRSGPTAPAWLQWMRDRLVQVQSALVVLRASLDADDGPLIDGKASAAQVPAQALARLLEQAFERAGMQSDSVPVFSEIETELMHAHGLCDALEAALWRASECATQDVPAVAMTAQHVFDACELVEGVLADVLATLRDAAELASEGGAA